MDTVEIQVIVYGLQIRWSIWGDCSCLTLKLRLCDIRAQCRRSIRNCASHASLCAFGAHCTDNPVQTPFTCLPEFAHAHTDLRKSLCIMALCERRRSFLGTRATSDH